jgi:hypothetical protein
MKKSLIVVAALAGLALPIARADEMVASNVSGDEVHLVDRPCDNAATLARIKEELRPQYRSAWAKVNHKFFYACWIAEPEKQQVFVVFDDGDQQHISTGVFKYSPGV